MLVHNCCESHMAVATEGEGTGSHNYAGSAKRWPEELGISGVGHGAEPAA